jgi:hypothetical protein
LYSANAVTAVLCRDHPNCMADFVKMMEDHAAPFLHLSEVCFLLLPTHWFGGQTVWPLWPGLARLAWPPNALPLGWLAS